MSSRNAYLSPEERRQALVLRRALHEAERLAQSGELEPKELIAVASAVIATEPQVRLDYLKVVDPDTLEDIADTSRGGLIAVAAFVGTTRLIDNVLLL